MLQQSAVFTYHVQPAVPLQPVKVGGTPAEDGAWISVPDPAARAVGMNLIEFVVAPEYKPGLRAAPAQVGMRYDTLFPDLDGLSREFNNWFRSTLTIRTRGIPKEDIKGDAPDAN